MVGWDPAVPTKVGLSGPNRRDLETGGKLSKNPCKYLHFECFSKYWGNADKAAAWVIQAHQEGLFDFVFGAGFQRSNSFV